MYVREIGAGPPVLLLHGTPSPAADLLPLAIALAPRFRALVPDLPGYGQSPRLEDSSMESVGDAIAAMLRARGAGVLHAVVGYSSGAYRAFDLLTRTGIQSRLLVSLAGIVNFDEADREQRRQFAIMLETDPTSIHGESVANVMRSLMLSEAWAQSHPADVQRVVGWLHTTTASALAAECRALAALRDLRPEVRNLAIPVYARVGALDVGAPPRVSEEIVSLVEHGALEIVPGCGHALLIEDLPNTVSAIVSQIEAAVDR